MRQKNMGFEDRVTDEHKTLVTEFLDRRTERHIFNDISFKDMVKDMVTQKYIFQGHRFGRQSRGTEYK